MAALLYWHHRDQERKYQAIWAMHSAATPLDEAAAELPFAGPAQTWPRVAFSIGGGFATVGAALAFYGSFLRGAYLVVRGFTR